MLWLALLLVLLLIGAGATEEPMEIFYINLQSSVDRRLAMESHLSMFAFPFHRVEAVTVGSHADYNLTLAKHPCLSRTEPLVFNTSFFEFDRIRINRLCIAQRNVIKEIAVTLSHIKAIYSALKSNSTSNYAMIMEDDMTIQFDINFKMLVDVFPKDFGAIQLFVINRDAAAGLIKKYTEKNTSYVNWKPAFYSAGGYLINKKQMRRQLAPLLQQTGPVFDLDLLAGSDRLVPLFMFTDKIKRNCTVSFNDSSGVRVRVKKCIELNRQELDARPGLPKKDGSHHACFPAQCCRGKQFIQGYPCVLSKDVAADYYVYNIAHQHTFTSTIPLLKGSMLSYNSTISSNHTMFGWRSLRKVERVINSIYAGTIKLPAFLSLRGDIYRSSKQTERARRKTSSYQLLQ